jgi:hypothetical protein
MLASAFRISCLLFIESTLICSTEVILSTNCVRLSLLVDAMVLDSCEHEK